MNEKVRGKYSPINPVAFGVATKPRLTDREVKSVVIGDNSNLLEEVSLLWIYPEDKVADVTYGNGVFWKNTDFKVEASDIYPRKENVLQADFCDLPYENESFDVVAFDPPYRPSHGSSSQPAGLVKAYRITQSIDCINDVRDLYEKGIKECWRILRPGGRILVKCQDSSYSNKLHLFSMDVLVLMVNAGFDLADKFTLVSPSNVSTSSSNQGHARRIESVLWVGIKPGMRRRPVQPMSSEISPEMMFERTAADLMDCPSELLAGHTAPKDAWGVYGLFWKDNPFYFGQGSGNTISGRLDGHAKKLREGNLLSPDITCRWLVISREDKWLIRPAEEYLIRVNHPEHSSEALWCDPILNNQGKFNGCPKVQGFASIGETDNASIGRDAPGKGGIYWGKAFIGWTGSSQMTSEEQDKLYQKIRQEQWVARNRAIGQGLLFGDEEDPFCESV